MLARELVQPNSIVVIGGSNNLHKPGGKLLQNLLEGDFPGNLFVVNPKEESIQGIKCHHDVSSLPEVELAILAIAARFCLEAVEILAKEKGCRGFIILSAGFSEEGEEGRVLEQKIAEIVNSVGGSLIGPNCIGVINPNYMGVFTSPIPKLDPNGCYFISGSGATAVFIMEAGMPNGLTFSSVYSVGNSAQTGVEDVLAHLDETFDPETSSRVILLYLETIENPLLLLKHASSLRRKGCKIAAIKSGTTEAGSRAASSHTGALASPDTAIDALMAKAGIVRCSSREELVAVASVFQHRELEGRRMVIITHAWGLAVMICDSLSEGGMEIPAIEGPAAEELLEKLNPGSSVTNPIDILATGTAEQLGIVIDYCETEFEEIDGMIVIFGTPGLCPVHDVYQTLNAKMKSCKKPIYPVLPSVVNASEEIKEFLSFGRINFPDEVRLGRALARVYHTHFNKVRVEAPKLVSVRKIRRVMDEVLMRCTDGYLGPGHVQELLDAAGISRTREMIVTTREDAVIKSEELGFPVVMKVVGPVHKSDVGGVVLDVASPERVTEEFERMIQITNTEAILIQPMLTGLELFTGAKREDKFGHLILCGLGGIFVEALKDVCVGLAPLCPEEAVGMIRQLKSYDIIKGIRGHEGVDEAAWADILLRLSQLLVTAPEIAEIDLNPLLGKKDVIIAVDARIRIETRPGKA